MSGTRKGSAGRQQAMGWSDPGGSGGYHAEKVNEAEAQRCAREDINANDASAANKTKSQPNHVGGPYAGT